VGRLLTRHTGALRREKAFFFLSRRCDMVHGDMWEM
jgi:hypothetical protein